MLLLIAVVLIVLWLLGFIALHIATPLIHLLIIIAIIIFIYDVIIKRRGNR